MDLSEVKWLDPPPMEPGAPEHLNCCQRTLMALADVLGVSEEQAKRMGAHFGGGMRCGGTCGPVNAALLALGALYGTDPARVDAGKEFLIAFAEANSGSWLCADIKDPEKVRCEAAIRFAQEYVRKAAEAAGN